MSIFPNSGQRVPGSAAAGTEYGFELGSWEAQTNQSCFGTGPNGVYAMGPERDTCSAAAASINVGEPELEQISMLQVDVHGHSALTRMMAPKLIMDAKIDLARRLGDELSARNFRSISWAGDGGVYSIGCRHPSDVDATVGGGEAVFRVLRSVNTRFQDRFPQGVSLLLRVSAHFASVLTVSDPRFWHGTEMNFFIKHERDIGIPGSFAITSDLRDNLTQGERLKFPESLSIQKVVSDRSMQIYFHEDYRPETRAKP